MPPRGDFTVTESFVIAVIDPPPPSMAKAPGKPCPRQLPPVAPGDPAGDPAPDAREPGEGVEEAALAWAPVAGARDAPGLPEAA